MMVMDRDYAEQRIREVLKASKGNAAAARQKIIAMAMDDTKLMHELVAPHITGIVAHAVNRVATMKDKPVPKAPEKVSMDPAKDPFGMEILKAIALGKPAQFGLESGVTTKKQAASQRHVDAIRQMVSKTPTKK
jgi:hypothetical protein